MARSQVKIRRNAGNVIRWFSHDVGKQFDRMAEEGAELVRRDLDTGNRGLHNETGAARASIYTITSEDSGYEAAKADMSANYLTHYDAKHLARRILEAYVLAQQEGHVRTAASSASLVMGWWEDGWTSKAGNRHELPHFWPMSRIIQRNLRRYFEGLLKKRSGMSLGSVDGSSE